MMIQTPQAIQMLREHVKQPLASGATVHIVSRESALFDQFVKELHEGMPEAAIVSLTEHQPDFNQDAPIGAVGAWLGSVLFQIRQQATVGKGTIVTLWQLPAMPSMSARPPMPLHERHTLYSTFTFEVVQGGLIVHKAPDLTEAT